MAKFISFHCFLLFLLSVQTLTTAYPLFTNSRWIVDSKGHRVKLACVNWPAHLQYVVAEGLSKQPMDAISNKIASMGFNCVRFTWPLELMMNDTLALKVTVRQSFERYNLFKDLDAIQKLNPSIIDVPLINAYRAVIASLERNGVMVILDNHLTTPGWCCSYSDGNGFFGDPDFDPDLWIIGLKKMATFFLNVTNVVGMSLLNELRGLNENPDDWYKYMQQGAEAVHESNPNVLVIVSGLQYDANLSFLHERPFNVSFTRKLLYELHWYAFTEGGGAWSSHNVNDFCAQIIEKNHQNGGFLLEKGFPLFLSEFGTDQRGTDKDGNRYMNCILGWAAENDVDWAIWALAGEYTLREGEPSMVDVYGMLLPNWKDVRNSTYLRRLSVIQPPYKGPGMRFTHYKRIFHPLTGLCIVRKSSSHQSELTLGSCKRPEPWTYKTDGALKINSLCLDGADEAGKHVKLGGKCPNLKQISASKMHLSFKTSDGTSLCLDVDAQNNIVANPCKCLSEDVECDPASQWFKIF